MRKRIIGLLSLLLLCFGVLPVRAFAAEQPSYVALGDSISAGYGLGENERPFPELLAESKGYALTDLSSNDGMTSAKLLDTLAGSKASQAIASADVITITVGGNDLMNALYEYLADAPGVSMSAEDIREGLENGTIDAVTLMGLMMQLGDFPASPQASAALTTLGANLSSALEQIKALNPDVTCIIANQYNPYGHIEGDAAESIVQTFDTGVRALNQAINAAAATSDVKVADVYSAFKVSEEDPCNAAFTSISDFNLDFHPNAYGHQLIAQTIGNVIGEPALTEYGISAGGVAVTSANASDVLGDNTVSYDPKTQTLKLNAANITGTSDSSAAIRRVTGEGPDSLTIELVGTNSCGSIVVDGNADDPCPLTIAGEGSLTVSETAPAGAISVQGDITVDGATLTVAAVGSGIQANSSSIAIKNGAKVNASATGENAYMALSAGSNVEVTGAGTRLVASTEKANGYYAVIAHDGAVTIGEGAYVDAHGVVRSQQQLTVKGEGTVLQAEGTTSGKSAVSCPASISVEGGASLTATGRCYGANGISVTNGSMLDVTAVGDGFAVDAQGPITVSDSTLKAKSTDTNAVYIWNGSGALTLTNSKVDVSSENLYALCALTGGIEMSGGMVTLSAPHSYATYTTGSLLAKDGVKLDVKKSVHGLAADGTVKLSGATGTIDVDNAALFSNSADVVIENRCDLDLFGRMTINAPAAKGAISISDSKLDVTGTDAVYATQDITIKESQVGITATENPVNTGSGSLTISGSSTKLTATGGAYVGAGDELVINGGEVSVDVTIPASEDRMAALYGNNAVRISGGTVDAAVHKADDNDTAYAIISNGVVEFTGGTSTLVGDTGAIYVSMNGGSVSFGSNPEWYQWATSPTGEVARAEDDPYSYDEDKSTYLRIEPVGTTYDLAVSGGEGSGSYVAGTQVTISADAFNASGHFSGWTVSDPTGAGVLASPSAVETTFTMPAGAVELTANYEPHAVLEHVAAVDPSCTSEGTAEHWKCSECGALFSDDGGTTLVSADDLSVSALGHHYVGGVCTVCGERDPDYVAPGRPAGPGDPDEPEIPDASEAYPDVPADAWYLEPVSWAAHEGVMTGYADGTFGPEAVLTRSQMATVLWRLAGGPEADTSALEGWPDLDAGAFYAEAVAWALGEGVFNGYADGTFGPEDALTREQAACVLMGDAARRGEDVSARADLSAYPDAGDVSAFASEAVSWAVAEGVISGKEPEPGVTLLDPQGACTRAELCALLMRLVAE